MVAVFSRINYDAGIPNLCKAFTILNIHKSNEIWILSSDIWKMSLDKCIELWIDESEKMRK